MSECPRGKGRKEKRKERIGVFYSIHVAEKMKKRPKGQKKKKGKVCIGGKESNNSHLTCRYYMMLVKLVQ